MTTGYTAAIERDPELTLRTFALHCALAFGACAHQRDDGAKVPHHREMTAHNLEAMRRAEARLAELLAMTPGEVDQAAESAFVKAAAGYAEAVATKEETLRRYVRMREMVAAWRPPTKNHNSGLKRFMLSQIDDSVTCLSYEVPAPKRQTGGEWLAAEFGRESSSLRYYADEYAKEVVRVAEANAWIDALVASLPEEGK